MANRVFVGTSLDGYVADREGGLDFLECVPNPEKDDFGYYAFIETVDVILMGRATFDVVLGFGIAWPYTKPVFVLSSTMKTVPKELEGKVEISCGDPKGVVATLKGKGFNHIYVDGGTVIQDFLREDMIDEMIITRVPMLLGGGTQLFADLPEQLEFELVETKTFLNAFVQCHYLRKKS